MVKLRPKELEMVVADPEVDAPTTSERQGLPPAGGEPAAESVDELVESSV